MNSSDIPVIHATRRKVLGWSGLSVLGGAATYLGWVRISEVPQVQKPVTVLPTPAAKAAGVEEEVLTKSAPAETSTVFAREAFVPHVNSEFTIIHEGDDSATCRLIEVGAESRMSSSKQTYASFSLVFEARPAFLREGGFCKVQHAKMGEMQFFLSPVGKPGKTVLLEAVFNLAI